MSVRNTRHPALPHHKRLVHIFAIIPPCAHHPVKHVPAVLVNVHPILGPTAIEGFWVANGFSGHGFKLGPAIGAMVARAITGDSADFDTEVPWQFLSIDRDPITADSRSVLA